MNTSLSKQSPKPVHEKRKRSLEKNYQYCNRYSTDSKGKKIVTDDNIRWGSKVHSNKSQSVRPLAIGGGRHDFSLSGRKMGKYDSTEATARDQNKLKPVNRDETGKAALRKTFPERPWKSAVSREPDFSSPKRQNFTRGSFANLSHENQQVGRAEVENVLMEFKATFTVVKEKRKKYPRGKRWGRVDLEAADLLKRDEKWINVDHTVGPVPGIEAGDGFRYRTLLAIVGLHREYWRGIHHEIVNGKDCATSIVDSGRFYDNQRISPDEFIYMGEGGNPKFSSMVKDQTLD